MNFYQDHAPTPFATVGNTGSYQPQLQQPTKSHILQDQYITGLENRLRALWDKYYVDQKHYTDRIKRLEEAGDALYENSDPTKWDLPEANARKLKEQEAWLKAKEDKL